MSFLSEEERMFQATVRDFATREIAPIAGRLDETAEFPWDLVRKMGELGWMGVLVPREYGGAGGSTMSYVLAIEELSRASAGVALIMAAHNSLACWALMTFGSEDQKRRYLPGLAAGQALGAYSLTEPNAGSDAASLQARAVRDGDRYLLNGRKAFVTSGDVAETIVLFASTNPEARSRGISAFILEKGMLGLTPGKPLKKLGMHCSSTAELVLEDVEVPVANRLGEEGQGFRIAMQVLDVGRIGIAAQALGIAQAALDAAADYATRREQFGHLIGEFEGVRWMLAEMHVRTQASRLLTYEAARLKDAGQPLTLASSTAKLHASETAMFAASKAIQVHGGYGYTREFPVERLLRDAKATELYEGTSEIQKLVISRELLGGLRPAF